MSTVFESLSRLTHRQPTIVDDAFAMFFERTVPKAEELDPLTIAAELSLYEFAKQAWSIVRPGDAFVEGAIFRNMCDHAQAVVRGDIKKLGLAVPPRHGKSLVINVFMMVWAWIHKPQMRFIFTSYSSRLANRDSMACRDLIRSKWFQDRWGKRFKFKEDQNTQAIFSNDRGGFRIATTPGGMATGDGADIIVADDITSVEESFSPVALETAWRYWTQTMTMRFHNPESIARIVTMQRTRVTDLLGRLIAEGFGYEVFTAPLEAEPHRIYYSPAQKSELEIPRTPGDETPPKHAICLTSLQIKRPELRDTRLPGEVLWPERFSNPETVKDLKKSVQAGAAGQLQQRPEADAGAVFKSTKFKLFFPFLSERGLAFLMGTDDNARFVYASECLWFQTIDTAMKEEQANDFTACSTFAKSKYGDLLVFDVFEMRLLVPEQWPMVKEFRDGRAAWDDVQREWRIKGRMRPWPATLAFQAVEDKNSGTGLIQVARSEGRPLKVLKADGNKVLRAATVAQLYESGCVYHNADGEWRPNVEDQLTSFPTASHDDAVDTIAYAGILFIHDNLLASYTGDLVYNESVHAELDAHREIAKADSEGKWIPPELRPAPVDPPESTDEILAAIRGTVRLTQPVVTDDGRIRPEFLADED